MSLQLNRVLLPTRFSELSRHAAEYVGLLLGKFDSELHVLHVVPHTEMIVDGGMPPMSMPIPGPSSQELLADSDRRLLEFVNATIPALLPRTRTFSVIGGITDEIIRHATQHSVDLIVMGTHADGMLKRVVFGSVGKGVLEGSPCPVLLVPARDAPR